MPDLSSKAAGNVPPLPPQPISTTLHGDVWGPVLSGTFYGPVHTGPVVFAPGPLPTVEPDVLALATARLREAPLDPMPDPGLLPPGSSLPFAPHAFFQGRTGEMRQLAVFLLGESNPLAVLTGPSGVGKSQLAIEFAHRYGPFFAGGVFWMACADEGAVASQVVLAGQALNLHPGYADLPQDAQVQLVRAAWQSPLPRLLIFDQCENEVLLAAWRPTSGGSRVLLTSRRPDWDPGLEALALAIDVLPRPDSLALLGRFRPDLRGAATELDELAAEVGDLPLALHVLGRYLQRFRQSPLGQPAAALAQLRAPDALARPVLIGPAGAQTPTGHALPVARTLALSYDRLNAVALAPDPASEASTPPPAGVQELARRLLVRAACLAPDVPIALALVQALAGPAGSDAWVLEEARLRLLDLGLVTAAEDGAIRLHRLMGAFVRERHAPDLSAERTQVALALASRMAAVNRSGRPLDLHAWSAHLRQVVGAADALEGRLANRLLYEWGVHLARIGSYAEARDIVERAIRVGRAVLGDLDLAAEYNALGVVLQDLGDLGAARSAYETSLTMVQSALGREHESLATPLNNLADLLSEQGAWEEARRLYLRALRLDTRHLGRDHPRVARRLSHLAVVACQQKAWSSARHLLVRALQIYDTSSEPQSEFVAAALASYGTVLAKLGDRAGGRAALERAHQMDLALFGPQHPRVARDLNSLGALCLEEGDPAGARDAYAQALAIDEAIYGPAHPNVALSVNNLGRALADLGDRVAARAAFERAWAILDTTYGADHPWTQIARDNIAYENDRHEQVAHTSSDPTEPNSSSA